MFLDSLTAAVESVTAAEWSTPLTSYRSLKECLFYQQHQVALYEGGVCRQSPLLIWSLNWIIQFFNEFTGPWVGKGAAASAEDVVMGWLWLIVGYGLNGYIVHQLALYQQQRNLKNMEKLKNQKSWNRLMQSQTDENDKTTTQQFIHQVLYRESINPRSVLLAYWLNPFTLFGCLLKSTILFTSTFVLLSLLFAIRGRSSVAWFCVACAAHLSYYPWLFFVPVSMLIYTNSKKKENMLLFIVRALVTFSFWLGMLFTLTFIGLNPKPFPSDLFLNSDWDAPLAILERFLADPYLKSGTQAFHQYMAQVFYFTWTITDLSPNLGLYWYFFAELFDTFRGFFIAVVQLFVVALAIPVCIKFRKDPLFIATTLSILISLFKTYPSLPDYMLSFGALLPLYEPTLYKYLRQPLLSFSVLFFSLVLLPVFHYAWIGAGTGNANFYYAITLLWGLGGVLLLGDLVFAWIRREWDLKVYGVDMILEENQADQKIKNPLLHMRYEKVILQ